MGNASSVHSSYQVWKTWMLTLNYKNIYFLIIIIDCKLSVLSTVSEPTIHCRHCKRTLQGSYPLQVFLVVTMLNAVYTLYQPILKVRNRNQYWEGKKNIGTSFLFCFKSHLLSSVLKIYLKKSNKRCGERWTWVVNHPSFPRFNVVSMDKKNLMKSCQETGIVEVLPYHECDQTCRPHPRYLKCLLQLQVQNITARFPVFVTGKWGGWHVVILYPFCPFSTMNENHLPGT